METHLHTHLLPLVMFRLGSPRQESNNILRHLRSSSRGTVIVLDETVEQDSGHGDTTTGEVRVVVHALSDLDTSGRVAVASKQRVDVVGTAVSGLDDQRKIRRKGTGVTGTSSLVVGVGSGHVVGELTPTGPISLQLSHLTRSPLTVSGTFHPHRWVHPRTQSPQP